MASNTIAPNYKFNKTLTAERLRELIHYDPETGEFRWLARRGSAAKNRTCGHISNTGYRVISIDRRPRLAHRLAYLYITGEWPPELMDHVNLIRSDNRWSNIRAATCKQNAANAPKQRINQSGYKGVFLYKRTQRWCAVIRKNGKQTHLGYFSNPSEAHKAYIIAAKEIHGEFHRG